MHLSKQEVIEYIRNFLSDAGGPWDWDDFISITLDDPELEQVRIFCASLPDVYAPTTRSEYCSVEGRKELRRLLDALSRDEEGSTM